LDREKLEFEKARSVSVLSQSASRQDMELAEIQRQKELLEREREKERIDVEKEKQRLQLESERLQKEKQEILLAQAMQKKEASNACKFNLGTTSFYLFKTIFILPISNFEWKRFAVLVRRAPLMAVRPLARVTIRWEFASIIPRISTSVTIMSMC
jgi:hypothetical protein